MPTILAGILTDTSPTFSLLCIQNSAASSANAGSTGTGVSASSNAADPHAESSISCYTCGDSVTDPTLDHFEYCDLTKGETCDTAAKVLLVVVRWAQLRQQRKRRKRRKIAPKMSFWTSPKALHFLLWKIKSNQTIFKIICRQDFWVGLAVGRCLNVTL